MGSPVLSTKSKCFYSATTRKMVVRINTEMLFAGRHIQPAEDLSLLPSCACSSHLLITEWTGWRRWRRISSQTAGLTSSLRTLQSQYFPLVPVTTLGAHHVCFLGLCALARKGQQVAQWLTSHELFFLSLSCSVSWRLHACDDAGTHEPFWQSLVM